MLKPHVFASVDVEGLKGVDGDNDVRHIGVDVVTRVALSQRLEDGPMRDLLHRHHVTNASELVVAHRIQSGHVCARDLNHITIVALVTRLGAGVLLKKRGRVHQFPMWDPVLVVHPRRFSNP